MYSFSCTDYYSKNHQNNVFFGAGVVVVGYVLLLSTSIFLVCWNLVLLEAFGWIFMEISSKQFEISLENW